jgi:hypothetical protein
MREDLIIKKERERISTLRAEVRKKNALLNSLDSQYKRVIDELRRQLLWWQNNAWKATFLSLYLRLKEVLKK